MLEAAGDVDLAGGVDEDVDLATDAEFGVVDAGFDGEAGVGEDQAFVVGFEVVEVSAIAVDFLADGVSRAVDEGGSVACVFDDVTGRSVEFPALEGAALVVGFSGGGDGGVTGAGDDGEDFLIFFRDGGTDEGDPGEVAVDSARAVELGPEVEEDEVALADGGIVGSGLGFEVGIAAVRADADDGRAIGGEAVAVEVVHDGGLDLAFADRAAPGAMVGDEGPGEVEGGGGDFFGFEVHGPLFGVPGCFKALDEVAGGDDAGSARGDELDGAGIDSSDVGDGVSRGVFHGEVRDAGDERGDAGFEFLPAEVDDLIAGQVVEGGRLDAVDEFFGLAPGRDEVEEAPGADRAIFEAEDATGQDVRASEVLEEPAIDTEILESGLDSLEVEHGGCLWSREGEVKAGTSLVGFALKDN